MKRSIIIACAMALGSSLGFAEDLTSTQTPSSLPSGAEAKDMRLFDSSMIENKKIMDQDGKDLGKLEKLLIDAESARVRFAVVQVDKEWSLNDPEVIIPFSTLQISRIGDKDYALKIDTTRDKLMGAPHFDKKLVHQLNTPAAAHPIYSYWGATWLDDHGSATTSSSTGTSSTGETTSPSSTGTSSTASPTSSSTLGATSSGTTSTAPGTNPSTPTTTSDGSVGTQSVGNTGTTDSPKPDSSLGQPSSSGTTSGSTLDDLGSDSEPSDRQLGGDETD
jgi:sporulation protein YlmC with PRC-barrel domain